jgi:glycosyltransferase involved in cell wall biosynthesis
MRVPAGITVHEAADLAQAIHQGELPAQAATAIHAGGEGIYRLAIGWRLSNLLLQIHDEKPFDLVEAPEVEALGLPLLLMPEFDAPVVTHLHCCTAIAQKGNGVKVGGEGKLIAALEFAAIHLADSVCAPTRAVVNLTRSFVPVRENVRIIPHAFGGGNNLFIPPPATGPILFVGRLECLKGVEIIATALNHFLARNPDAVFRFVGPDTNTAAGGGSMRQWIQSQLSPELRPRVEFAGEISPEQVSVEWKKCRFGVMPSLFENFSMACCEAMANGRAVIVAEGTGSVELVGDSGAIVERGSASALAGAMERLWIDQEHLENFSRAAHERLRAEFAPARVAAVRGDFYRDCIRDFAAAKGSERAARLMSLPPECAAAILPAMSRMTGLLSGASMPSRRTPGTRLLRIMEGIEASEGRPAQVLLYGAGKHTARLFSERHVWESRRHRVVGIIDDHPRFAAAPVYLDLPVQSLENAKAAILGGKIVYPVVLSTDTYQEQFWAQAAPLREAGVPVLRLYD